jgi:hypothetical protein
MKNMLKNIALIVIILSSNLLIASEKIFDYLDEIEKKSENWIEFYDSINVEIDLSSIELESTGSISDWDYNDYYFNFNKIKNDNEELYEKYELVFEYKIELEKGLLLELSSKKYDKGFLPVLLLLDTEMDEYLIYSIKTANNVYDKGYLKYNTK